VLTTDTLEQALARAGVGGGPDVGHHGNKGHDAAAAAVEMADLLRQLPKRGA
jgi:6,7-dimethyl-8-ribityllumazine synthase